MASACTCLVSVGVESLPCLLGHPWSSSAPLPRPVNTHWRPCTYQGGPQQQVPSLALSTFSRICCLAACAGKYGFPCLNIGRPPISLVQVHPCSSGSVRPDRTLDSGSRPCPLSERDSAGQAFRLEAARGPGLGVPFYQPRDPSTLMLGPGPTHSCVRNAELRSCKHSMQWLHHCATLTGWKPFHCSPKTIVLHAQNGHPAARQ